MTVQDGVVYKGGQVVVLTCGGETRYCAEAALQSSGNSVYLKASSRCSVLARNEEVH